MIDHTKNMLQKEHDNIRKLGNNQPIEVICRDRAMPEIAKDGLVQKDIWIERERERDRER